MRIDLQETWKKYLLLEKGISQNSVRLLGLDVDIDKGFKVIQKIKDIISIRKQFSIPFFQSLYSSFSFTIFDF